KFPEGGRMRPPGRRSATPAPRAGKGGRPRRGALGGGALPAGRRRDRCGVRAGRPGLEGAGTGMLLWTSSGEFKIVCCGDEVVELAGDVALEAPDDLLFGQAVLGASFGVGAGAGVPAQAAQHDAVEGGVGVAVAAAVEAVPVGAAG